MKKFLFILISFAFIASTGSIVTAQSRKIDDPANDVYIPGDQTVIRNKQYIDIREIGYSFGASGLTLTMKIQGAFSDDVTCTLTLNTEDVSYVLYYDWCEGSGVASSE